jgi:hypothetical protein
MAVPQGAVMNLIDTDRAREWLAQFEPADVAGARRLAESIQLIARTDVEAALERLITREAAPIDFGSVALFAVRELDPEVVLEDTIADPLIPLGFLRPSRKEEREPQPYFSTDKSERPSAVRAGTPVGSEGPIANLIRDICARINPGKLLDHPSLDQMRQTKCRCIILVDDIIGSGSRVSSFLRGFIKHPTIKSWFSLKLIRIVVVTHAANTRSKAFIEANRYVHRVDAELYLDRGSPEWNCAESEAIEEVCRKYSRLTSRRGWPLGKDDAFTCLCFDYKCPNTMPSILWAGYRTWRPLFRQRPYLDFPVWPSVPSLTERQKRVLAARGQSRLAASHFEFFFSVEGSRCIVLLGLVAKGVRSPTHLAVALGISETKCKQVIDRCRARGWLTASGRLSGSGREELKYAKELRLLDSDDVSLSEEYYFPRSLRAPRD